jgi:tetratricopeptide (TPR) repeat protein
VRAADGRFAMLETIREVARELLGEEPATRAAHAGWYLALAEEGGPNRRGAERAAWLERVGRERENLRAALAWSGDGRLAAALGPFWVAHGLTDEGKRSLEAVLARPEPGRARALAIVGLLRLLEGEVETAEEACRESLARLRAGEEWYRALVLNVLGTVARYRGHWEAARQRYEEALALDLWWPAALANANLGALAELESRPAEALERQEQALAIAREGGDEWMIAACLMNGGRAARRLGDFGGANARLAEALRGFVALENSWGIAACLASFAALAGERGEYERAARLYAAEAAIRERARLPVWPTIEAEHETGLRVTAAALGAAAWERARGDGRALTQAEAIAEALPAPVATG